MKYKLGYEGEKKKIGIIYIIWIMVLIPAFFMIINALKNNNFSFWYFWFDFLILIGFGLLITLIYIPTYIEVRKNLKNIDLLKIKGKKAKGIIKEYSSTHYRLGSTTNGYERYFDYYVSVSYFDEILNRENTITTPKLSFNPQSDLGSFDCTVYYSDSEYYVTDFVRREKGQENIWGEDIDSLEKAEIKKAFIYISLFILLWISVVIFIIID